jgi:RecB family exonuclease
MEREPTRDDVDALVGPATPHFAYQIRARVRELIQGLPDGDSVRAYGEEQMAMLDRLGHASSTARDSPRESRERIGWNELPSSAPEYDPLR